MCKSSLGPVDHRKKRVKPWIQKRYVCNVNIVRRTLQCQLCYKPVSEHIMFNEKNCVLLNVRCTTSTNVTSRRTCFTARSLVPNVVLRGWVVL